MMSGDSPNSHGKEFFDFKEGRSTPPPTTSKDIAVQSNTAAAEVKSDTGAVSVLAEPLKEHGPATNCIGFLDARSDSRNDDDIVKTDDKCIKEDDRDRHEAGDKGDAPPHKLNGSVDMLDGQWIPPADLKKQDEEQDDNCTVRCLYYTLQCCECTIM